MGRRETGTQEALQSSLLYCIVPRSPLTQELGGLLQEQVGAHGSHESELAKRNWAVVGTSPKQVLGRMQVKLDERANMVASGSGIYQRRSFRHWLPGRHRTAIAA